MHIRRSWLALLPAVCLLWILAGDGLWAGLFPDEMMNIYGYWHQPWPHLLRNLVTFWNGEYRPLGGLFYRPLFELFAFNPLPYRLICFGLLTLNLALAYRIALCLSGSILTAAIAAWLFAYHAYLSDLYYSSATIYDLLCFFFTAVTLLLYFRWHAQLTVARLILLAATYWLALNSKEMALALPLIILTYEIAQTRRDLGFFALSSLLAVLTLIPRFWGPAALAAQSGYHPQLSLVLPNLRHYFGMMLYQQGDAPLVVCLMIILAALATPFILKSPATTFAATLFLAAPYTILLIPPRSLYAFYLPYFGLTLLIACWIVRITHRRIVLLVMAILMLSAHLYRKPYGNAWVAAEERKVQSITSELHRALPTLPKGAHVLIDGDPFDADDYLLTFIFRLYYRDDTLAVGRTKAPTQPDLRSLEPFTCSITLKSGRLSILKSCS